MNEAQRTEYWAALALRHTGRLGPRTWKKLLDVYPSPYAAVLDAANWADRAGIAPRVVTEFRSERWRTAARQEWDAVARGGWRILLWTDARYPHRLKEIQDPPIVLYYAGDASLLSNPGVGVVGSRLCSRDGIATTRELCRRLSASGVTTVSGLARGIDSEAHKAALESWGSTIAVLGTGPDLVYPPENAALHARIMEAGLLLTEFAPGTVPDAKNFPMRNRIISGLSLGVLVVEAASRSGSLITARHALDQGREVFAVPGRVQARTSAGCHDLIRQGAKAVFSCDDVLVEIAPLIGINADEWCTPEQAAQTDRKRPSGRVRTPAQGRTSVLSRQGIPVRQKVRPTAMPTVMSEILPDTMPDVPVPEAPAHGMTVASAADAPEAELTPDERAVFTVLEGREAMHIDEVCRALSWQAARASSVLLILEVQGLVRQLPGMHYSAIV